MKSVVHVLVYHGVFRPVGMASQKQTTINEALAPVVCPIAPHRQTSSTYSGLQANAGAKKQLTSESCQAFLNRRSSSLIRYRAGHCHGTSTRSSPETFVSLNRSSKVIERHSGSACRVSISAGARETTSTCQRSAVPAIRRPSAGSRSGCRLVSGSLSTSKGKYGNGS